MVIKKSAQGVFQKVGGVFPVPSICIAPYIAHVRQKDPIKASDRDSVRQSRLLL